MRKIQIRSRASVIDEDGVLWLSDFYHNALYSYNTQTKEIKWIDAFDYVEKSMTFLHNGAYFYGENIYFFPFKGKIIGVYNKKLESMLSIEIPKAESEMRFLANVQIGQKVFFVSDTCAIWECDLRERQVSKKEELSRYVIDQNLDIGKSLCISAYEEGFVIWDKKSKSVIKINVVDAQLERFIINIESDIEKIYFAKNRYWILLRDSLNVIAYDKLNNYVTYVADVDEWICERDRVSYYALYDLGNAGIYITNYNSKYIMKLDMQEQKVKKAFEYPDGFFVNNQFGSIYTDVHRYKDNLYFVPDRGSMIISQDIKRNIVLDQCFMVDPPIYWWDILNDKMKKMIEYEGNMDISDYINWLNGKITNFVDEKEHDTGRCVHVLISKG